MMNIVQLFILLIGVSIGQLSIMFAHGVYDYIIVPFVLIGFSFCIAVHIAAVLTGTHLISEDR